MLFTIIFTVFKINTTYQTPVDHDEFIPANLNPTAFHSPERPSVRTPEYTDFLRLLYNNDFTKQEKYQPNINKIRHKRALIFRPLFVYREQEITKIKIKEHRKNMTAQAQQQQSLQHHG